MLGLGSLEAAEPSAGWKAGVARVDTTPTAPGPDGGICIADVSLAGRGAPARRQGPRAGRRARVTRSSSSPATSSAFRRGFTNRVTERVKAKYGLPREDVVLFASHNHAGPALSEPPDSTGAEVPAREGFENNVAYTKELEDKIVALVGEALAKMEPASLSYGVGRAHFALNRREPTAKGIKLGKNPAGPTDESVPILRVQNAGGKPLAIVFGYACHNTTLRPDMMKIAADFAGYAQDRIEADNPGAVALFVTGCAGDADPHPFGTLEMAREHGEELGEAVKFVLDHPTWLTTLTGPLRTAFTETTIRFGGPTDRASYEKLLNDPNSGPQAARQADDRGHRPGPADPTEYPYYSVHAFALGDQLTLVALSGEVVVDYAIRLQKELGGEGRTLWVAAYANDVVGYIPSVRVLKEGGYEGGEAFYGSTWPAPFAEDIESIVVNAAHEVVKKVRQK